jgi:hypothetical protein
VVIDASLTLTWYFEDEATPATEEVLARSRAPEDLSGNLIVQLGLATEDLNRTWYERNTGRAITAVQTRVKQPSPSA